jgi:hypothetical protein
MTKGYDVTAWVERIKCGDSAKSVKSPLQNVAAAADG